MLLDFLGKGSEKSRLFKSLEFFITKVAAEDIESVASLFKTSSTLVFTPAERDEFNRYVSMMEGFYCLAKVWAELIKGGGG